MSRIPSSESRRRPAEVPQPDRGSKTRKVAPSNFAPVASLSGGTVPVNAHVPPQPESFLSMHTRALGKLLMDANKLLTAGQRRTVIAMGFGPMLNFHIADTPLHLGNWLLSNLDIDSMQLKLPNGLTLKVDEEAVEAVFGLPRGPKVITDRAKHQKSIILNSWRESYEKTDYTITPAEVAIKLEKYPDGGECFIRNYALLVVLYVDRVRAGACTVPRTLPAFVGWDSELLKQREELEVTSGGFGRGAIVEPLRPKKKDLRVRTSKLFNTARSLVGIHPTLGVHAHAPPPSVSTDGTETDDNFYSNPDVLKAVEEIEHAVHKRNALYNGPSLSGVLPEDAGTTTVRQMTNNATSEERASGMSTRSGAKHNCVTRSAQPSSSAPPISPPQSIRVNGVTAAPQGMSTRSGAKHNRVTPSAQPKPGVLKFLLPLVLQVVAQALEAPLSTTRHQTGSAPHIATKPSRVANHPSTPVVRNQSYHMAPVDEIEPAVLQWDVFSDVPSFSLGLTQDAPTLPVRHTTTFATSQQRATVITTPNATPGRLHHSLRDDGVTATPQDVASILGTHTSTSVTPAGRALLNAPRPPRDSKHHPTPVRTKLSHHVSQMGGRPSWTVTSQTYVYRWIVDNLAINSVHVQPSNSSKKTTCTHTPTSLCHKAIITCMGSVITTPNAAPGRLHHSLRDDGVTATPQDMASILGTHTSTSGTPAGRAPLKAPKPPRYSKHHPTPIRTKLSHHIVDNLAVNRDEEIFRYKTYKASWGNVASLQEGNKVAYRVVDAWACVLNYRELTKNASVLNRLFASTKTALQSAVNYTALRSLRLGWFTKSLEEDLSNSPHETWRGIHIGIFMISVDTIAKKVDIIDSSSAAEPKDKLYSQTPKQLVDMLSTFLDDNLETEIASQIRDLIPKRMQMSWRVPKNQVGSVVFTMRHMESYRGQGVANWDVGLQRGNYMQICVLRQYFMREILMSDINIHQNSNIKRALNFANGLARNTPNTV
nr:uncharacterized protein LOC109155623 isoform X1 [Ipomoea batatas]